MPRNYAKERANYGGTPEQKARNAARKRARREAIKLGMISPGSKKQIDHKDGNPMNNNPSNLQAISEHANKSYPRTKTARKKNPHD